MNEEKFYEIAKKEGFIGIIRQLLQQKVDGDPWKERYIPVLSILAVIVTAIAPQVPKIFAGQDKQAQKPHFPASDKYLIREKYAQFCSSLVSRDLSEESNYSIVLKDFYSLQSLIPRISLEHVHRAMDKLANEREPDNRKITSHKICVDLNRDLNKAIGHHKRD